MIRRALRVAFVIVLVFILISLGTSYLDFRTTSDQTEILQSSERPYEEREPVTAPSRNVTVVTAQGTADEGPKAGVIVAIDTSGRVLYLDDRYYSYFDVDPVPNTAASVMYVAVERADESCVGAARCWRQIVETVNLTTGQRRSVYTRVTTTSKDYGGKWHDVDRSRDTLYVADITSDSAFRLNLSTKQVTWSWNAQDTFSLSEGGGYPRDFTHINDIERLDDRRVMVSPRNMDQVLFIDPDSGVQHDWTLGREDDHEILYEPHNPDYIPKDRGGPAVLISDSENHRVVEYQRVNGAWERSWSWQDEQLAWPRDADRLPSDHTLITDSNGDRIIEVAENGSVVWTLDIINPYDAERIGTGDESANGMAAAALNLESRSTGGVNREGSGTQANPIGVMIKRTVPGPLVNAVLFVRPAWMSLMDVLLTGLLFVTILFWTGLEAWWRGIRIRSPFHLP